MNTSKNQPEKIFECDNCKMQFTRNQNLLLHKRTVHAKYVNRLKCPLCPNLYGTLSNWRVHMRKHHRSHLIEETETKITKIRSLKNPMRNKPG